MVERRHAPGESERRFVGEIHRHAEAKVLRRLGHGRHEQQGIVDWRLGAMRQRRIGVAAKDVIDAEHIGKEYSVETAALQSPGEFDPIIQANIVARPIAWMAPESRRLMHEAIHLKRVEADFPGHVRSGCLSRARQIFLPPQRAGTNADSSSRRPPGGATAPRYWR